MEQESQMQVFLTPVNGLTDLLKFWKIFKFNKINT